MKANADTSLNFVVVVSKFQFFSCYSLLCKKNRRCGLLRANDCSSHWSSIVICFRVLISLHLVLKSISGDQDSVEGFMYIKVFPYLRWCLGPYLKTYFCLLSFYLFNSHAIFEKLYQVSLGQDECRGFSNLGLLNFFLPIFDIIKGVFTVGGCANHKGVRILELGLAVDTEMLVTWSIVDFDLDLPILDVLGPPVDIEDGRLVFLAEDVVNVVPDQARLTDFSVSYQNELKGLLTLLIFSPARRFLLSSATRGICRTYVSGCVGSYIATSSISAVISGNLGRWSCCTIRCGGLRFTSSRCSVLSVLCLFNFSQSFKVSLLDIFTFPTFVLFFDFKDFGLAHLVYFF